MVGRTIAHYQIVEKLGEGGMGVVYKARDTHLDRFVAIKVLPPEKVADASRKARFVQEAKAASALNHPNIITIYDIASDAGCDFIAMEYVAGKTLEQLIGRKGLALNETLKYSIQIADALTRAHGAGIVHRDLKPSNVMVDEHGLVKVLDFGLAKLTELLPTDEDASTQTVRAATEEGTILGTAAYMSPEQAEGKKVDARSDIFSFGSVLYEMVSGRRAFQGDSKMSTLSAVLHQEPKPIEGAPRDLEKIIARCLRKDPERRFQLMKDVKVELEELKEESDSGKLAPVSASPAKRRGWIWAAAAGVAAVALAGWLGLKYGGQSSPLPALVQLTAYPGSELYPTFSPDGKQVAFAWDGEKGDNQDIYVKLVGETNALRLTTDLAPELAPAWSPDGKRIAFQRNRPGAPGIWSVSPLGGAEQKLADLQVMGQMFWSPDGKWLAVAQGISIENPGDACGILLVPADGGEPRRMSDPRPPACDVHPSFSPDGRLLAYASCTSVQACDVFVQPLEAGYAPRGEPRRITRQGVSIFGIAWSRDGGSLIYSGSLSFSAFPHLWRVGSTGGSQPERFDLAGVQAVQPSVAVAGDRLAFSRSAINYDIWRYQPGGLPEPFIASSLHDWNAQLSPDRSKIAFQSSRSGLIVEIWTANADGSQLVQLTKEVGRGQGAPRWSPDGRLIAFHSQGQDGLMRIYVIDADGGRPRRVTPGTADDQVPSWSRDGKWIYFSSKSTGRFEVWRISSSGGPAQQITSNGGHTAFESVDGKTLFYMKSDSGPLFAKALDGGPERKVLDYVHWRAFAPAEDGICYIGRPGPDGQYPIQFCESATGASRVLVKVAGPLGLGLSVSPDRKTILFSRSATTGADLMLVENFR